MSFEMVSILSTFYVAVAAMLYVSMVVYEIAFGLNLSFGERVTLGFLILIWPVYAVIYLLMRLFTRDVGNIQKPKVRW